MRRGPLQAPHYHRPAILPMKGRAYHKKKGFHLIFLKQLLSPKPMQLLHGSSRCVPKPYRAVRMPRHWKNEFSALETSGRTFAHLVARVVHLPPSLPHLQTLATLCRLKIGQTKMTKMTKIGSAHLEDQPEDFFPFDPTAKRERII